MKSRNCQKMQIKNPKHGHLIGECIPWTFLGCFN